MGRMGGFQNMVMWREWRQVVSGCICCDLRAQAKPKGVVWGVFFCCFCSGSRAHAKINKDSYIYDQILKCSGSRAHAKINCW